MAAIGVSQLYETSYNQAYKRDTVLPPIKFHQLPSLELAKPTLQPRQFPLIPPGPRRRLQIGYPLGLGLGTNHLTTEQYVDPKPVVRTVPPRKLVNVKPEKLLKRRKSAKGRKSPVNKVKETWYQALSYPTVPLKSSIGKNVIPKTKTVDISLKGASLQRFNISQFESGELDEVLNEITWKTTLQRATEAADIAMKQRMIEPPLSTYEENSDLVKYRPAKYAESREIWQEVSEVWDHVQTRPSTDKHPNHKIKLKASPYKIPRKQEDKIIDLDENIKQLVTADNFASSYMKPCPAYAGFVPRSPIQEPFKKRATDPRKLSIMKSSYRRLPVDDQIKEFAHKGPLSRTVTLTYPYNPFNKREMRSK